MRPILPPDLDLLTRAMLSLPAEMRAGSMARLLADADLADRFRKRTGRLHPEYGDGSVLSLALRRDLGSSRASCDAAYLAALSVVVTAIGLWRGRMANHHLF